MPDYPEEGALRGGHIPGARVVPWARAAAEDGTLQVPRRSWRRSTRRSRACARRRRDRLLPDRRAVEPHLVRADPPARLRARCATTTAPGPSGATPCGCRSSRAPSAARCRAVVPAVREPTSATPLPTPARRDRRRLRRAERAGPAAAAARLQPRAAGAAGTVRGAPASCSSRCPSASRPSSWPSRSRRRTDTPVPLFFSAPPEAPTTRGFAGILAEGLDGLTAERGARGARRPAAPARAGRRGQPAAAARDGRDARPDQAAGAREGRA